MAAKKGIAFWVLPIIIFLFGVQLAVGAMDLPEKLKQIPLYPGSKLQQVTDLGAQAMATLSARGDQDSLLAFYKQQLNSRGWKTMAQFEQEGGAGITFSKNGQVLQLSVKKGDGGSLLYGLTFVGEK